MMRATLPVQTGTLDCNRHGSEQGEVPLLTQVPDKGTQSDDLRMFGSDLVAGAVK